jgi:hypothetical protein
MCPGDAECAGTGGGTGQWQVSVGAGLVSALVGATHQHDYIPLILRLASMCVCLCVRVRVCVCAVLASPAHHPQKHCQQPPALCPPPRTYTPLQARYVYRPGTYMKDQTTCLFLNNIPSLLCACACYHRPAGYKKDQAACFIDNIRAYQSGETLKSPPGTTVRMGPCPPKEDPGNWPGGW